MSKAAIPLVKTGQVELDNALQAIKQNLDAVTGQARNSATLAPLPASASLADVIKRTNDLLSRMQ